MSSTVRDFGARFGNNARWMFWDVNRAERRTTVFSMPGPYFTLAKSLARVFTT
jgi:hypothetical protein